MADLQKYGKSANLFAATWESGTIYADGAESADTNAIRTGYMGILPNTICEFDLNYTVVELWVYYYTDNAFISRKYLGGNTFTTPNNCTRVRFRATKTGIGVEPVPQPQSELYTYGWVHSLRKLTTATEAVENPLYSDGTAITAYTLKGNEEHTGTPSPQNPVIPNGVGEKTKNLLKNDAVSTEYRGIQYTVNADKSVTVYGTAGSQVSYLILMGDGAATNNISAFSTPIFKAGDSLIFSTGTWVSLEARYTDGTYYNNIPSNQVITLTKDVGLLFVQVSSGGTRNITVYPMITLSTETDTTYEPWGYKIPIPNGQQTTNIYLGSTQTVRAIKKLVLTGQETVSGVRESSTESGTYVFSFMYKDLGMTDIVNFDVYPFDSVAYPVYISSHFKMKSNKGLYYEIKDGEMGANTYRPDTSNRWIIFATKDVSTIEAFKSYLADQYAAGTPVTIWYVLATPATGIVNEPLMKIGDYADTLSNATAIPTTEGANSITVGTTVQPSEFTATWTGWHNATVKEFNGTTWQGIVVTRQVDFTNNTSPVVPSAADLAASSVYSGITRCNVTDDGTITAYYGDAAYKEDGSNGQVMVKIPKFYYKLTSSATSGTAIDSGTWSISDQQVDNTYELHPAFLDANGNEIDYFLVGAFDGVAYDGTSYTATGDASYNLSSVASATVKPVNNFTRAVGRTMGTNRGTGWYQLGFKQIQALTMLFGVEFGFNSQVAVGMGNVGTSATLYPGVTTGNTTSGDTSGQSTAVNWRGIENLWGNIWDWIDGFNIVSYVPYFCKNYAFVDDVTATQDANYEQIGFNVPTSNGTYPTRFGYDVNHSWVILPIDTSSTENANGPIGDGYWVLSGSRVARLGGHWTHGTSAGLCYWTLSNGSSDANVGIGSRPMFIPSVTIVSRTVDFQNFTSYTTLDVSKSNVYTNMKRCNVADDGTINAFDGDTGYVEDGTNGQVMVYVPKFWYKLDVSESGSLDGNNIRKGTWSISDAPADGFKLHPAFINASGNEVDYFLYGAFDAVGQDSNGTYSTSYNSTSYKLGSVGRNLYAPSNSFTRATARTMATNRGTGWYQAGVKQTMAIQMLFAVEYGFNSQLTVGNGVVGASTASKTGITTDSTTSGTKDNQTTPVNWRGIENFWGNIWNWIDGLNLNDRVPYVCNTFNFVDNTSTDYTQIAFSVPSSNAYVSALGYDSNNDWIMLPSEASGANENSAIGDYIWTNTDWCTARLGGSQGHGAAAGSFCWALHDGSSAAGTGIGSRIMFIP